MKPHQVSYLWTQFILVQWIIGYFLDQPLPLDMIITTNIFACCNILFCCCSYNEITRLLKSRECQQPTRRARWAMHDGLCGVIQQATVDHPSHRFCWGPSVVYLEPWKWRYEGRGDSFCQPHVLHDMDTNARQLFQSSSVYWICFD